MMWVICIRICSMKMNPNKFKMNLGGGGMIALQGHCGSEATGAD